MISKKNELETAISFFSKSLSEPPKLTKTQFGQHSGHPPIKFQLSITLRTTV